jgi:hypothetical protein
MSVTLLAKAMPSFMAGQDGLGEGLATGADTATDEWPLAATAALTELN